MSGIAGIIHFDGKPVEPGLIEGMTSAMAHRGPDGINHWTNGSVALGQCMLRTTPESLEEHQPLTNDDRSLVLVMDGRVDNWDELRRELLSRGARLRSRADAELVLRAYECWGTDCLTHVDGDFALVFWDLRRREAVCARDRIGHKPLHYHWNGKTFSFASDLRPLLALPWISEKLNEGMLAEFLASEWYSRDETLWEGIMRLPAACRMTVQARAPRIETYWAPDFWATLPHTSEQDYVEHYREIFADSVRRLSRSHCPVACEVSGGLDSSAVFAMGQHLRRSGQLPAPAIQGYTLAFDGHGEEDELEYARQVGQHHGVVLQEISPSFLPLTFYRECASRGREFPGFPNGSLLIGIRRRAVAYGSRVMLTGEWGDAWLEGSRMYYADAIADRDFATLLACLSIDARVFGTHTAVKWIVRNGLVPLLPFKLKEALHTMVRPVRRHNAAQARDYWLSSGMRRTIQLRRERLRARVTDRTRQVSQEELIGCLYEAFSSQVMERLERLGSVAGLEMRHPLGTAALVQFAFSTPVRLRLRGDRTKYVHVQAMRGLLPEVVLERRTKAVFTVAFRRYLDSMEGLLTDMLPKSRSDWITPQGMTRLFRVYKENPAAGWPLWTLWSIVGCDLVAS